MDDPRHDPRYEVARVALRLMEDTGGTIEFVASRIPWRLGEPIPPATLRKHLRRLRVRLGVQTDMQAAAVLRRSRVA